MPSMPSMPAVPAVPAGTRYDNRKDKVVSYEKRTEEGFGTKIEHLTGIENHGAFYKNLSYNVFEAAPTEIPADYVKRAIQPEWVDSYICGTKRIANEIQPVPPMSRHPTHDYYFTHNNGGGQYLVYVPRNRGSNQRQPRPQLMYIYAKPTDLALDCGFVSDDDFYTELVATYNTTKVYVPKGVSDPDTPEEDDPEFRGNTIVAMLPHVVGETQRYVFVGTEIYEFELDGGDTISKYHSLVGNSDVPYPVLVGRKAVYFMLDHEYVPMKHFNGISADALLDGYQYYYDGLSEHALPMTITEVDQRE